LGGKGAIPEEDGELPFPQRGEFLPGSLNPLHKLRCPARLPDLPGSSGPLLEASSSTERSTSGFPIFSQVTAKKRGLSKVEDFKDSLFFESPWILASFPMAFLVGKLRRCRISRICLKHPCSLCAPLHRGAGPFFF
jgi:hypothetical protein